MTNLNVKDQVAVVNRSVLNILKYHIPHESITINNNDPRWSNKRIKSLIQKDKEERGGGSGGTGEGGGEGAIINDVLKLRKVIQFESSCIVICFSNHRWKNIYQLRK